MPEKIRILLVDPAAEMLRLLGMALSGEDEFRIVDAVSSGREALRSLQEKEPDVVIVAEGLQDVDATNLVWQMTSKRPHLPVVALGPASDQQLMRRFMVMGARGYVNCPVDFDDLRSTVRAVFQSGKDEELARLRAPLQLSGPAASTAEPSGAVVAVFGAKGGVGKTALAVNLGVTLQASSGESVCLVDADFSFGDAALHLDLNPRRSILNFLEHYERERGNVDPQYVKGIMVQHDSGLHVLCRPPRPEQAELLATEHIEKLLTVLCGLFRFVVVDCHPSYDDRMLAILDQAEIILLVLTPDMGSITNSSAFLDLGKALGYERERVHLVLNRVDSRVGIEAENVGNALGCEVEFTLPSAGRGLTLSVNRGRLFCLQAPRHPYCQSLLKITEFVARQSRAELSPIGPSRSSETAS